MAFNKVTPEVLKKMQAMHMEKMSRKTIAEALGVAPQTVAYHMNKRQKNKKVKEKEAPKHPTGNGIPKPGNLPPVLAEVLERLGKAVTGKNVKVVQTGNRFFGVNADFPEEKKVAMMMELRDENHQLSYCLAGLLKAIPDEIVVSMFLDYRKVSLENDELRARLDAHHRAMAEAQGKK